MTSALALHRLGFSFDGRCVLHDVDCTVPQGAAVGFIGPNGGGKTTLMRLIVGALRPTTGSVSVFGMPPDRATREGLIGYVPQRIVQTSVGFPATVREVVASGCKNGMFALSGALPPCCHWAVDALGIRPLLHRSLANLSGGERQKVFIARALSSHPKFLLLDEPTTGIDQASQDEFFRILRTLRADGMTIAIVSHDTDAIARETDRLYCVDHTVASCALHPKDPHHHHVHAH